jgi:SP family sugar:H+ symporter-like MFS transporter
LHFGFTSVVRLLTLLIRFLGVIMSLFIVNRFGRRPLLIGTGIFMTLTDVVIGAIGIERDRSAPMNTAIVAMIMLYVWAFNLAWGPLAWACATELSHGKNKTKIMSVGTAGFWVSRRLLNAIGRANLCLISKRTPWFVQICAWAVTFTLPYLFDEEQANLGPMVGWIYAGGGLISVLFVYFCIPETLGRR